MRGTYLEDEATFFKPKLEWAAASTSTVSPDEKEFVVDSGASMHVMSMTDVSPEELETVKVCRLPTTVMTATGSIDTTEEGIVCGKDLDMLVTVQLLEDTPERRKWAFTRVERSSNTSFFSDNGKIVLCKCDNFVPIVVLEAPRS